MTEQEFRSGGVPAFNYIDEAAKTLSPSWHGDMVAKAIFLRAINAGIQAANNLDKIKKTLFYGKDNNLIAGGEVSAKDYISHMDCGNSNAANIVHAIIGKFTKAGELLEALRNCYNGEPFDAINAKEEVGDGFWYDAILARECGFTFDQAQKVNIAKLRARFPNAFTEHDADNRDLTAERNILSET